MTPIEHEEHIGYARFVENVEQAEGYLDEAARGIAPEHWADAALVLIDEADKLLADDGPRGCGACMAQSYREREGYFTAAQLRERAAFAIYGAAEASAITGGHVEAVNG